MSLLVNRAGFLTTIQDLGRVGHRASGVSMGGALDPYALRIVNLLVGNDEAAAGIEVTLGTVRLRSDDERVIAWAGGAFQAEVDGCLLPAGRAALVRAEEEFAITAPASGARGWLAISGGIDVPLVLGSRSTDLRGGFGGMEGRALRDGDVLPLGQPSNRGLAIARALSEVRIASWGAPNEWSNTRTRHGFLRVLRGAESSEFAADALLAGRFTVAPESDRMGVRLQGAELRRDRNEDLISEPVVPGTIQVPPDGQPIILLGDCQTIGGYPKIAHVITVDLAAAAQLFPGDSVRFAEVGLDEAQRLLIERERDVERFGIGLTLRLS
ncbi:MAG: biotin-dependent carboxyltransferase family protein [Chthoniobacterales bacterium]